MQIATKLNRSHLFHGEIAYLLPCLGRTEIDVQASGAQIVTIEDSPRHIHGSRGRAQPASEHLRSELAIVAASRRRRCRPIPTSTGTIGSATMPWSAT